MTASTLVLQLLIFMPVVAAVVVQRPAVALRPHPCPRAPLIVLFGSAKLPEAVDSLLDPTIDRKAVLPLWREFRACYPSEQAAAAAARKNTAVLLPFMNSASNIKFCRQVLGELGFDDDEALEIMTKNPGVLGNKPGELARSSQGEIRFSVRLVSLFDGAPAPVLAAIPSFTAISIVAVIAKRLNDCAGGICG